MYIIVCLHVDCFSFLFIHSPVGSWNPTCDIDAAKRPMLQQECISLQASYMFAYFKYSLWLRVRMNYENFISHIWYNYWLSEKVLVFDWLRRTGFLDEEMKILKCHLWFICQIIVSVNSAIWSGKLIYLSHPIILYTTVL